jgi:hypothetical protein
MESTYTTLIDQHVECDEAFSPSVIERAYRIDCQSSYDELTFWIDSQFLRDKSHYRTEPRLIYRRFVEGWLIRVELWLLYTGGAKFDREITELLFACEFDVVPDCIKEFWLDAISANKQGRGKFGRELKKVTHSLIQGVFDQQNTHNND